MPENTQPVGARRGNPLRIAVWGAAALLLLLPLVAMRFTDEVAWTPADFIVMGAMLSAACGAYELATRMTGNRAYRAAVGVAVVAAFLLVWVNLAVGIIGNENNPANLLFAGVLAVGLIGALLARFQPRGMARAMVAMAVAQALVAVVVLVAGWDLKAVPITAFFAVAWLVAGWLFGRAARGVAAGVTS